MRKISSSLGATVGVAALLTFGTNAMAGTSESTLAVGAQVIAECKVVGGTLDFGTYVTGQQAVHDAVGNIDYEGCLIGTIVVELDGGSNGATDSRRMRDSAGRGLRYQIYSDTSRSQVWGQGSEGKSIELTRSGGGSIEVYGRISGGQSVAQGTYADTIAVTLAF